MTLQELQAFLSPPTDGSGGYKGTSHNLGGSQQMQQDPFRPQGGGGPMGGMMGGMGGQGGGGMDMGSIMQMIQAFKGGGGSQGGGGGGFDFKKLLGLFGGG